MKKITLNIGDIVVTREPFLLETTLGSCVAVCLWDKELKIAGMNHYMMPYWLNTLRDPMMCGPEAIDALIAMLLEKGQA